MSKYFFANSQSHKWFEKFSWGCKLLESNNTYFYDYLWPLSMSHNDSQMTTWQMNLFPYLQSCQVTGDADNQNVPNILLTFKYYYMI